MTCNPILIVLAGALAACVRGPDQVDVSGTPGDLRFTVVAAGSANRACANALSVTPVMPDDAYPAWQVSSLGTGKCIQTLRYGELTADVTQKASPSALQVNVAYRVRVSGAGFSVVRDFRLSPTKVAVLD